MEVARESMTSTGNLNILAALLAALIVPLNALLSTSETMAVAPPLAAFS
jgi:hypothetical protein